MKLAARIVVFLALCAPGATAQEISTYQHYEAVYASSTRPIEAFATIVRDRPSDGWARYFQARAFIDGRDLHAARVAVGHAVRLDPEEPFHRKLLGDVAGLEGDQEAAAREYRAAAALESRADARAWLTGLAEEGERVVETGDEAVAISTALLVVTGILGLAAFAFLMRRTR